jgi:hypothetical protein
MGRVKKTTPAKLNLAGGTDFKILRGYGTRFFRILG